MDGMEENDTQRVTVGEEERRNFLKLLGITGGVAAASQFSLSDVRNALGAETSSEMAAMGEAIRADLTGSVDADVLASSLTGVASAVEALPDVRAAGFPAEEATPYQELTQPAWAAYEHLSDVGFFASAEEHLPAYTSEGLATTTEELVRAEPLTDTLHDAGFSEEEITATVASVTSQQELLKHWVPANDLPGDIDEFNPDHVAPLHQRAAGGALLWMDGLDDHLWRNEVLVTEEMHDAGVQHAKTMLGGFHLLTTAAHDIAGPGELEDSHLAAGLAGGAAILIAGQENMAADVYRITDEMRADGGIHQ